MSIYFYSKRYIQQLTVFYGTGTKRSNIFLRNGVNVKCEKLNERFK
jgi:hypothetical protein